MKMIHLFYSFYKYREMIRALAIRDIQSKYVGTLGGSFWIFASPLATVVIFYFVFAVGFKATGPNGAPFILWFVCGLVPWLFFNSSLMAITNSIVANMHLVQKTIFPTEIFAFTHLFSESFTHLVFLTILCGMLIVLGVHFETARLLFLYYFGCMVALLLGLGWMLSALQVFYRDIALGLVIFLNLLFWG
ncbi:MAG: ABC transporter permease, partial [Rhodospirillales bacterium]|nr:ABC transporter permease [Rhodospirillales bacterium]